MVFLSIPALLAGCSLQAEPYPAGRYQLQTVSSGEAYVLDTRYGELQKCTEATVTPTLICYLGPRNVEAKR